MDGISIQDFQPEENTGSVVARISSALQSLQSSGLHVLPPAVAALARQSSPGHARLGAAVLGSGIAAFTLNSGNGVPLLVLGASRSGKSGTVQTPLAFASIAAWSVRYAAPDAVARAHSKSEIAPVDSRFAVPEVLPGDILLRPGVAWRGGMPALLWTGQARIRIKEKFLDMGVYGAAPAVATANLQRHKRSILVRFDDDTIAVAQALFAAAPPKPSSGAVPSTRQKIDVIISTKPDGGTGAPSSCSFGACGQLEDFVRAVRQAPTTTSILWQRTDMRMLFPSVLSSVLGSGSAESKAASAEAWTTATQRVGAAGAAMAGAGWGPVSIGDRARAFLQNACGPVYEGVGVAEPLCKFLGVQGLLSAVQELSAQHMLGLLLFERLSALSDQNTKHVDSLVEAIKTGNALGVLDSPVLTALQRRPAAWKAEDGMEDAVVFACAETAAHLAAHQAWSQLLLHPMLMHAKAGTTGGAGGFSDASWTAALDALSNTPLDSFGMNRERGPLPMLLWIRLQLHRESEPVAAAPSRSAAKKGAPTLADAIAVAAALFKSGSPLFFPRNFIKGDRLEESAATFWRALCAADTDGAALVAIGHKVARATVRERVSPAENQAALLQLMREHDMVGPVLGGSKELAVKLPAEWSEAARNALQAQPDSIRAVVCVEQVNQVLLSELPRVWVSGEIAARSELSAASGAGQAPSAAQSTSSAPADDSLEDEVLQDAAPPGGAPPAAALSHEGAAVEQERRQPSSDEYLLVCLPQAVCNVLTADEQRSLCAQLASQQVTGTMDEAELLQALRLPVASLAIRGRLHTSRCLDGSLGAHKVQYSIWSAVCNLRVAMPSTMDWLHLEGYFAPLASNIKDSGVFGFVAKNNSILLLQRSESGSAFATVLAGSTRDAELLWKQPSVAAAVTALGLEGERSVCSYNLVVSSAQMSDIASCPARHCLLVNFLRRQEPTRDTAVAPLFYLLQNETGCGWERNFYIQRQYAQLALPVALKLRIAPNPWSSESSPAEALAHELEHCTLLSEVAGVAAQLQYLASVPEPVTQYCRENEEEATEAEGMSEEAILREKQEKDEEVCDMMADGFGAAVDSARAQLDLAPLNRDEEDEWIPAPDVSLERSPEVAAPTAAAAAAPPLLNSALARVTPRTRQDVTSMVSELNAMSPSSLVSIFVPALPSALGDGSKAGGHKRPRVDAGE